MAEKFELIPINGRASFNRKATVTVENGIATLKSYDTNVATYNTNTKELKIMGYFSITTGTHINAFLDHYGLNTMTKKEIIAYAKK